MTVKRYRPRRSHRCRHLFITSLERARISPKTAQTPARPSDIRLTLGICTHVDLSQQVAANQSLNGAGFRAPECPQDTSGESIKCLTEHSIRG